MNCIYVHFLFLFRVSSNTMKSKKELMKQKNFAQTEKWCTLLIIYNFFTK